MDEAYALALVAAAPAAQRLADAPLLALPLLVLLFTLPATNLALNLGHLSGRGPALTFPRIAPIATG
jgi:hypothetical protein